MTESKSKEKAIFLFFKKIGCPPCGAFHATTFAPAKDGSTRLTTDPDLAKFVIFREVEFGAVRGPDNKVTVTDFSKEYPDMVSKIQYAPFLWFHSSGNREKGFEYPSSKSRDLKSVKEWITNIYNKEMYPEATKSSSAGAGTSPKASPKKKSTLPRGLVLQGKGKGVTKNFRGVG